MLLITSFILCHKAKALSKPRATSKNWIWHSCTRAHVHMPVLGTKESPCLLWVMRDEDHYVIVPPHNTILTSPQALSNLTTLMDTSCPWAAHCRCRSCPQKDRSRATHRERKMGKEGAGMKYGGSWRQGTGRRKCFLCQKRADLV